MTNKVPLKQHLASRWYVYVAYAVLVVLLWTWIVPLVNKPSEEERITVFVCCIDFEESNLKNSLEEQKPDYIRKIDLRTSSLTNYNDVENYGTIYELFALLQGDIVILPATKINDAQADMTFFSTIDSDYIESYYGKTFEYLTSEDGTKWGIKIEAENNPYLTLNYETTSEEDKVPYYLLFNNGSKHIGELNDSPYTGALELAKEFLQ